MKKLNLNGNIHIEQIQTYQTNKKIIGIEW